MRLDDDLPEDDVLDLETEVEQDDDTPTDEQDGDEGDEPEGDADETLIGFEDEEPLQAEPENSTIRRLREQLDVEKRLRKEAQARAPKIEVGDKPTMEGCDYNEAKYDEEIEAWKARKVQAEEQAKQATATDDTGLADDSQAAHAEYTQQKAKLARPDFDQAQIAVETALSNAQQGVLVMASKNKAALVYALGKSPERLNALAEITNPIKLAIAVADMERNLKVQARRKAPAPEGRMRGGAPAGGAMSKEEARLAAQADKTGDRTALAKFRYEQRQKR